MTSSTFTLYCAHNVMSRLRGLHGIGRLHENAGLWLRPCNAIHTFFMVYAIDVVFLDRRHKVLKQVSRLEPNRVAFCLTARSVIELPGGYCARNPDYARVLHQAICDSGNQHPMQASHSHDITVQCRQSNTGNIT